MGESFPMMGGDGAYSYYKNSQFQKNGLDSAKGLIEETIIEKFNTQTLPSPLRIADYGCSAGTNTFSAMEIVTEAIQSKCSSQGLDSGSLEFHIFFSDLTSNDFNTLFASIPQEKKYYAAGVPGSFHGRVFPRASIDLAFSSYALHWLSRVPEGVSAASNRGRIFYAGAHGDVVRAYSNQFGRDVGVFLSARGEEVVRGGLMFLIIPGIPEGLSCSMLHLGATFNFLESCLMELADEGVIDKSRIDGLNVHEYFPTLREMKKLIEMNGCFSIERMALTTLKEVDAYSLIMVYRAGLRGIFIKHLGTSVEEKLFEKALAKSAQLSKLFESNSTFHLEVLLKYSPNARKSCTLSPPFPANFHFYSTSSPSSSHIFFSCPTIKTVWQSSKYHRAYIPVLSNNQVILLGLHLRTSLSYLQPHLVSNVNCDPHIIVPTPTPTPGHLNWMRAGLSKGFQNELLELLTC